MNSPTLSFHALQPHATVKLYWLPVPWRDRRVLPQRMSTKQIVEPSAARLPPHTAPLSSPRLALWQHHAEDQDHVSAVWLSLPYTSHQRPTPVHSYIKSPSNLIKVYMWNPIFMQGKNCRKNTVSAIHIFFLTAIKHYLEQVSSPTTHCRHLTYKKNFMHFFLIPSVFFYFILIKVNTQTNCSIWFAFYVACIFFYNCYKYIFWCAILLWYTVILKTTTLCLNVSATVAKEAFSVLLLLLSFATAVFVLSLNGLVHSEQRSAEDISFTCLAP